MSLHSKRLAEAEKAYLVAEANRRADQMAAKTDAEAEEAMQRLAQASLNYDLALKEYLASTSHIAQAAYDSAVDANAAMDRAREGAQELEAILRIGTRVNTAVTELIKAASVGPSPNPGKRTTAPSAPEAADLG